MANLVPFPSPPPTGRMLYGDPHRAEIVKNDDNTPKLDKTTGEPIMEYVVGVAYAKNDPAWLSFKAWLGQQDRAAWPQFFDAATGLLRPGVQFSTKITDGDGYNKKGEHYGARDGWAGHEVIRYSSRFAPSCFEHDGRQWVQAVPDRIKPGDYVQVSGTTGSNESTQTAGMYRNLGMVALVGKGTPIIRADANPNDAFGAAPPPLPPGASAVPQAPGGSAPPAPPPAPGAPPPAPAAPTPPPPAPPAPPAPPPAPVKTLKPGVAGTYEGYIAAGWTDVQLIQNGLMDDYIPH